MVTKKTTFGNTKNRFKKLERNKIEHEIYNSDKKNRISRKRNK